MRILFVALLVAFSTAQAAQMIKGSTMPQGWNPGCYGKGIYCR